MRRVLPLLALLSLAFAPAPRPRPADQVELRRLRGEWVLVSETYGGKAQTARSSRAVFSGCYLDLCSGQDVSRWKITVDPRASPKAMDRLLPTAKAGVFFLQKAAYSLEGDRLEVCYDSADWWARPKDLSGKGPSHHLLVYKRHRP
jgi:uncharacterized protein (TIGR03067 family)